MSGRSSGPRPVTSNALLRAAFRRQRRTALGGSLLFISHQAGEIGVPIVAALVIDKAIVTSDVRLLVLHLLALAAVFATLSYSWRFGDRLVERATEATTHELVVDLTTRILHPAGGLSGSSLTGELVSTASSDAGKVGSIFGAAAGGAAALGALIVASAVLLNISLALGLLILIGLPPVLVGLQQVVRPLERRFRAQQDQAAAASGVATDLIGGLRILKGLGAEVAAGDRYRAASQNSLATSLGASRLDAVHEGLNVAVTGALLAGVAFAGGRLAAQGRISIGELIAAVGLTQFLIGPLFRLGSSGADLARSRASARRVADVLSAPFAVTQGCDALTEPVRGELVFDDVSGSLSLKVAAGEFVGVVALDPADAYRLLDLLARNTSCSEGRITLDGVEVGSTGIENWRAAVVVSPHDADLFEGKFSDNVLVAAPHPERLAEYLAAAGADGMAAALPDGIDTPVTERGRSLSGGQRQRTALARALASEAPVLVLHDPTSAVDAATEARIAVNLSALRSGMTTLIVTTSPALLAVADRVLVLAGGSVTGEGTHSRLLVSDPAYAEAVLA